MGTEKASPSLLDLTDQESFPSLSKPAATSAETLEQEASSSGSTGALVDDPLALQRLHDSSSSATSFASGGNSTSEPASNRHKAAAANTPAVLAGPLSVVQCAEFLRSAGVPLEVVNQCVAHGLDGAILE